MKVVLQNGYNGHNPQIEKWPGHEGPYIETFQRALAIKAELEKMLPHESFVEANVDPDKLIRDVHSERMIDFLEENTLDRIVDKTEVSKIILGSDIALSLSKETYECARGAVSAAVTGADMILEGEGAVYALCRPPGHHATRTRMGGYCFFNNAAIAAVHLIQEGKKVFVLDIDLHHGNGTQDILYGLQNSFFFSINGSVSYPGIISGRESSRINTKNVRNMNMFHGAEDLSYMKVIHMATQQMSNEYDVVVVSAGFDTSAEEPEETLGESERIKLSRKCFAEIGKEIEMEGIPTLIVQEGGYCPEVLAGDACAFLSAFAEKR